MVPPAKGVKVRMYRTGLGDCFLLALPRNPPEGDGQSDDGFYVLVDCGVYKGTPEPGNATRINEIVQDIRRATADRLDVLIITHEHWDHVSAFHESQAQARFANIWLGTLWLAWTENLDIKLAKDLHDGRKAARVALARVLERMQGLTDYCGTSELVRKVLDFFGGPPDNSPGAPALTATVLGAKSVQTESAMKWIKETYGKDKTKFLHPGDGPLSWDGVPDARVYILGPPEDPELIKRYSPSASGEEVYPRAMAAAMEAAFFAACGVIPKHLDAHPDSEDVKEAQALSLPFDEEHQVPLEEAQRKKFFQDHYFGRDGNQAWRHIETDWFGAADEFALQLDSATNNTSLAFALEIGPPGDGKVLLFPGDAQVGNWQSWFGKVRVGKRMLGKDMVWKVGSKTITAEDLLRRTVLYKVGHHGSHNGTLRAEGLERMGRPGDLVALLPVDEHVARDLAHYGEMPLRSLVKDLAIRTGGRVARSDEGAKPKNKTSTLAPIPGAPPLRVDFLSAKAPLYFEYVVTPPR
jgi:hypothetical protein